MQVEIEGFKIDRCPLRYINSTTLAYLDAYFYFTKGFLPNEGGWLKQPMKLVNILVFMQRLIDNYEEEKNAARSH